MSLSTATSIFPPQSSYTPLYSPYEPGGLGSYTVPYSRTIGYAEAWGFTAYSSSTPNFLPPHPHPPEMYSHLPYPHPINVNPPHFAPLSEDVSMLDATGTWVPHLPTWYNPPFVPPAEAMVWSSSLSSSSHQDMLSPRRLTIPDDGPLPQPGYSFGTGGKRASTVLAHVESGSVSDGASDNANADASGHGHDAGSGSGIQIQTAPGVGNSEPGEEEDTSPGTISNKTTTTPIQTTPQQLTPRPESPLFLRPSGAVAETMGGTTNPTSGTSGDTAPTSDDNAKRGDAESAPPSSRPSSSPIHTHRAPNSIMPHPLAPLLPFSSSSPSSIQPGQCPLPSPPLENPPVSTALSSRFGSIDSGRFSLFSSSAEAESISSVPATASSSYATDSCSGSFIEDHGIVGGMFERDVQSLSSDHHHKLRLSLATETVSPTSTTGSSASASTTTTATTATARMLPPPLSYSLGHRRASCPALVDSDSSEVGNPTSSLPYQPGSGVASSASRGERTSTSPETPLGMVSSLGTSKDLKIRPPVPTPVWDSPSPGVARRTATAAAAPSSSASASSVTFRGETGSEVSNHALMRVSSFPTLARGYLSAALSPVSRPSGTGPGTNPSSSPTTTLNLGPAFGIPEWERLAPPAFDMIHAAAAPPADASPQSDEAYQEVFFPMGESPSSASAGSVSTPFSTPATTVGWSACDHPTYLVRLVS